ncbi:M23 family metallopeptidase [Bacillus thermotolerans]|uniref:M23 family metallopeptidase n=1 Tax=Bacillus thermotolerans TaxID=1221996 RepID=UPI0005918C6D|nr:M23 family metallopeptidase [Bacillus thermotolerans]KKB43469.1 Stage IV sporulation protein FA (SpoIVFA) [Bacillus thermotolerans]
MKEEKELSPLIEEKKELHPLFNWNRFLFKCLASISLVLIIAIIFKQPSPALEEGERWVRETMEREFPFAKAAEWYENALGAPLPFTAENWSPADEQAQDMPQAALPASGHILEDFQTNGRGILVEIGAGEKVRAVKDGTVIFNGEKEGIGKTVVVQHADNSESWYGHLASVSVLPYTKVKAGDTLAEAKMVDQSEEGQFYLAIKQDGVFIDPNQVIPFD